MLTPDNLYFFKIFKKFRSNILDANDNRIIELIINIETLESRSWSINEDKKIKIEKFIAISNPSINGKKSLMSIMLQSS